MQNIDWQIIATFLLIAVAGAYAIRKFYLFFTSKAGCSADGCNGCGSKKLSEPENFVSIDALTHHVESTE